MILAAGKVPRRCLHFCHASYYATFPKPISIYFRNRSEFLLNCFGNTDDDVRSIVSPPVRRN